MKRWFEWVWDSVVVITCCLTVVMVATLIASCWENARQLDAVYAKVERLERTVDELTVQAELLDGRLRAIEINLWRY